MPNQRTRERKKRAAAASSSPPVAVAPTSTKETVTTKEEEEKKSTVKPKEEVLILKPGRQRGVWRVDKKKYGFLSSEEGVDIFVHSRELRDDIKVGDAVEFNVIQLNGRPKATQVTKVKTEVKAPPPPPPPPPPPVMVPPASEEGKPTIAQAVAAPAPARARPPTTAKIVEDDAVPQQNAKPEKRLTGACQWYTPKKKHGFIKPDALDMADIFVHAMDIRKGHAFAEGDRVEYSVGQFQGRPKAVDVIKLPSSSDAQTLPTNGTPTTTAAEKSPPTDKADTSSPTAGDTKISNAWAIKTAIATSDKKIAKKKGTDSPAKD